MAAILIAEDDVSLARFLGTALERAGHRVTVTHDGLEALKVLESNQPLDLLLTDIVMPGMDGIELSRHATSTRPALKIMYITGFSAVATDVGKSQNPNARLVSKPFHLGDLVAQVESLLRGE